MSAATPQDIALASMKTSAAALFFDARLKDFEANALSGTYQDLERARQYAIGAAEALIDAKYNQALFVLKNWGIDPTERMQ